MIARCRFAIVVASVLLAAVALLTSAIYAQKPSTATTASAVKVGKLARASNFRFVQKTDVVWYSTMNRKSLKDFKLVIATQEDMLVTFVTVATKPHFELTPELMRTLLTFNSRLDYVKVYLDSDGDMTVRCDSSVRVLDLQRFNDVMDQVAASANEIYEGIQSFLTK
jgi:hypothetical protein